MKQPKLQTSGNPAILRRKMHRIAVLHGYAYKAHLVQRGKGRNTMEGVPAAP